MECGGKVLVGMCYTMHGRKEKDHAKQEVLILFYEYGYKAKEIADLLGLNLDTVYKRLDRARDLAKEQFLSDK